MTVAEAASATAGRLLYHVIVKGALFLAAILAGGAMAQAPDPRLPVSTLVREDIFAGYLENDTGRLDKGEQTLRLLLEQRPAAKGEIRAWQGGAALYRAVRAYEHHNAGEFKRNFTSAQDWFSEAARLAPDSLSVASTTGVAQVMFADRLPRTERPAAWAKAYDAFQFLWSRQAGEIGTLPTHLKGELLAGLAQSAYSTGRIREVEGYLDRMIQLLPHTPYIPQAQEWKRNLAVPPKRGIVCRTCHEPGTLSLRLFTLGKQP